MTNPRIPAVLSAVVLALAIAGCGDNDDSGAYGGKGSPATAPAPPAEAGTAIVDVASVPELGRVIVGADGFTLYDFHKDKGTASSCYGACAKVWPPLLTGSTPEAAGGVSAAKLGTTERRDGTTQVTFAGHPLYTYAEDEGPGDATGNDIDSFGAEWYALEPSGAEPED